MFWWRRRKWKWALLFRAHSDAAVTYSFVNGVQSCGVEQKHLATHNKHTNNLKTKQTKNNKNTKNFVMKNVCCGKYTLLGPQMQSTIRSYSSATCYAKFTLATNRQSGVNVWETPANIHFVTLPANSDRKFDADWCEHTICRFAAIFDVQNSLTTFLFFLADLPPSIVCVVSVNGYFSAIFHCFA